jgi:reactive chlorine resistance protein C
MTSMMERGRSWEPRLGGFPAISVVPGRIVIKDIVMLADALWSLGEALPEARS